MMRPESATIFAPPAAVPLPTPSWVLLLFDGPAEQSTSSAASSEGTAVQRWCTPSATLLRLCVPRARQLSVAEFESAVASAYGTLAEHLLPSQPHVVRCWNYLPGIGQMMDERRDRYMVFNAGRFAAFTTWFPQRVDRSVHLPAATAVGHAGDHLQIDLLAAAEPAVSIENARQVPPVRYSATYGPQPPCFARAVRANVNRIARLYLSGTASIRGEATVHPHHLAPQLAETWSNFDSLLEGTASTRIESLRVYCPRPQDRAEIEAFLTERLGHALPVEFMTADLCRPDLCVEMEAVAAVAGEVRA